MGIVLLRTVPGNLLAREGRQSYTLSVEHVVGVQTLSFADYVTATHMRKDIKISVIFKINKRLVMRLGTNINSG